MRALLPQILALALLAAACSGSEPGGTGASGTVVATIDGDAITLADLDTWIKEDLFRQQVEGESPAALHEFRAERLERLINERLVDAEARQRGVTREQLLEQQAAAGAVSATDVEDFYEQNRARLAGTTLEEVAPRIRQHLERQEAQESVQRFVAELRESAAVAVTFEAPRIEVAALGASLGPDSAPVTIIEFSDFQCPFCARSAPLPRQLVERYPGQVRVVYRHFPIDSIHPRARAAAEASACAHEQGRFWEYHDALFANARALEDADLERYAGGLSLDLGAFRACVAEGRYREAVERDLADGRSAGVSGTPSFFVNGRLLGGAQPLEAFGPLIEGELSSAGG